MDFDDHDDHDEEEEEEEVGEMQVGGGSSYEHTPPPPGNSLRKGAKLGGAGESQPPAASGMGFGGLQQRKVGVGGSGGSGTGGGGRYRECLKNHAVSIGGHAVDGCGEFMAAGEEGTLDALKCAACNCHRNFHRKEVDGPGSVGIGLGLMGLGEGSGGGVASGGFHPPGFAPYYRTPAGYLHHHQVAAQHRPPPPLALPSTSGGGWSRDEEQDMSDPMMGGGMMSSGGGVGGGFGGGGSASGSSKKRFRTKFTQEQKDRMLAFAERVGWRIQKHDEAAVQQFCDEVGVKRQVLKVWMHNNKHTLGRIPQNPSPTAVQPIASSVVHQQQQVDHKDFELRERIPGP